MPRPNNEMDFDKIMDEDFTQGWASLNSKYPYEDPGALSAGGIDSHSSGPRFDFPYPHEIRKNMEDKTKWTSEADQTTAWIKSKEEMTLSEYIDAIGVDGAKATVGVTSPNPPMFRTYSGGYKEPDGGVSGVGTFTGKVVGGCHGDKIEQHGRVDKTAGGVFGESYSALRLQTCVEERKNSMFAISCSVIEKEHLVAEELARGYAVNVDDDLQRATVWRNLLDTTHQMLKRFTDRQVAAKNK